MSYRVDIPTLSANEVYTLTFEYEGTETIQLIVGDLTLETTDRRVVFTTTSPVNYIESNVNLTNLNMYEGCYESDDFGGVYTQESYLSGKSMINLISTEHTFPQATGGRFDFKGNFKEGVTYTIWYKVSFTETPATASSGFVTNNGGGGWNCGQLWYDTTTGTCLKTVKTNAGGLPFVFRIYGNNTSNVDYLVILEGDYVDDINNGLIKPFEGIGCVKSPKIVSQNEDGTEESVISTPDDLELYEFNGVADKLDLTTNILTKNIKCIVLDGSENWVAEDARFSLKNNELNFKPNNWTKILSSQYTSYTFLDNASQYDSYIIGNGWSSELSIRDVSLFPNPKNQLNEFKQYLSNNPIKAIYLPNTPTTEQLLNIPPLKSYKNGSITTSSQQLTPTLTTTLPISNKFTQTNLISGTTYNIYFDGTATRLDCGGTIVNNPVSPCQVMCGGTTLTIDGEVSNVRVLETSVKNEVGTNGTNDVELSRIEERNLHNYFDEYKRTTAQFEIDYSCSSVRDDNRVKIVGKGSLNYAGYGYPDDFSFGTYKFHCKVKVSKIGDEYRVVFHASPNNASNNSTGFATPRTASKQLIEEINYVGYFRWASKALFYTYYNGQEIEYYDISLIKLSDEDITGTDTSAINYSQTISKLEQPIKLRSLGTTYDSYNPKTGELTKRIGVSETDGSYSVLSSPIVVKSVPKIIKGNVALMSTVACYNGASKSGDTITLNKGQTHSLAQITGANTIIQAGVKYLCVLHDVVGSMDNVILSVQHEGSVEDINFDSNNRAIFTAITPSTTSRWVYVINTIASTGTISFKWSIIEYQDGMENWDIPYFSDYGEKEVQVPLMDNIPQLYKNGQVKVYSDSEVYPTAILNGQSTNNYEINGLATSNNYTIRYEGECESINLANKSNAQGSNTAIKAGATSGNLTFVNDNGNINNVMLVQNDVREQEINHFTGLQTVEVSKILIENQRNMWSQDFITDTTLHQIYQRISKDYIKVEPNETLYASTGQSWMDWCSIYQYDENKNKLSDIGIFGGYGTTQYQDENGIYKNIVKLSGNTYYIRIVLHNGVTTTASVSRGGFLPPSTLAYNTYQGQFINLPQPVQLNSLPDGVCDTYNPITGEYIQRVNGKPFTGDEDWNRGFYDLTHITYNLHFGQNHPDFSTETYCTDLKLLKNSSIDDEGYFMLMGANFEPVLSIRLSPETLSETSFVDWLKQSGLVIFHEILPITTQLPPIEIPVFEGGILQLITTDGKVFPMIEYSLHTTNRYDTSTWETGVVYTQRNMTEAYFNDSTTPMTPTETMTLTTDHISSGSIILNDNGNGLIVLKGNYTGRDIPYFTGMRSVEAIEVETTPSPDQPLFGKGGRK